VIASSLLGLDTPEHKGAVDAFNIVIQGGAILAVLLLYWPRFAQILRGLFRGENRGIRLAFNLLVAFCPAAILGPLLDDFLEQHLFFPSPVILALALGGVYMIVIEWWRTGRISTPRFHAGGIEVDDLTPRQALWIGLAQCVAMIPGTSRSMMTITAGVLTGLKPRAAAEFSFLLGVPTLGAACLYTLAKDVWMVMKRGDAAAQGADAVGSSGSAHQPFWEVLGVAPVAVGFIVATISAAIAVRWLVGFLNRHGLTAFGVYRIVLALGLLGLLAGGMVRWS
jgi:undecaprenyl-diphosphatase